jgi:hypothetical protein
MTGDEFWGHIAATRDGDPQEHPERLVVRLAQLPPDDVLDFGYWWDRMMGRAYRWTLWAAAELINGGCSDDGFEYFRDWLILQGRAVYEAALRDPDALADVVSPGTPCSHECYILTEAWFAATGRDPDDDAAHAELWTALEARHPDHEHRSAPFEGGQELGERWDTGNVDEVRRRLPRLAALYLRSGDAERHGG